MMRRTLLAACLLLGCLINLAAQKKIVLRQIRYNTVIDYLQQKDMQQLFAHNLNALLLKYQQTSLSDTANMPLRHIKDLRNLDQKYDYRQSSSTDMQLAIDMLELSADKYFISASSVLDPAIRATIRIVYYMRVVLTDGKNILHDEHLYLLLKNNPGPGMGNESTILPFLPKTFVELIRTGLNIALNPQNQLEQVVVGIAPAFAMDDYLVPALQGQPRILVDTTKNFYQFSYQGSRQLLRVGEAMYEDIIWKGRKARPYPESVLASISLAPDNTISEFIFLRSDGRDVLNNRNYQLQLMVQINPVDPLPPSDPPFTGFMPGPIHLLYEEKNVLAQFSITKKQPEFRKKIFPDHIYNGLDSGSVFVIEDADLKQRIVSAGPFAVPGKSQKNAIDTAEINWGVQYSYVVKGVIRGLTFAIYCGPENSVKEIYLRNKLVCVAQGKSVPEKFVVFDASLPSDLLNPLLLIGFNSFFW